MVPGQPMDVVIHGLDRDPEQVARNLGHLFGIDMAHARRIVRSVPCVAKRKLSDDDAQRYVRALAASGCKAEARPSAPESDRPAGRSLPAPRVSGLPELDAEERAAIDRWRRAEGLEPLMSGPPRSSRELAHSVPRAPRLPGDLGQSSHGTDVDGRPAWLTDDPAEVNLESSTPPGAPSFSPHRHNLSNRPGAVGVVRSSQPAAPGATRSPPEASPWQRRGLLFAALCALAVVLVWRVFGAEDRSLRERWAGAGIGDTSPHLPYAEWIEGPDNRLVGTHAARAMTLIDALQRSGVQNVWVVAYRADGAGHTASRLVLELPSDEASRQTALWHLSRFPAAADAAAKPTNRKYFEVDLR